jgi:hypothetical protein
MIKSVDKMLAAYSASAVAFLFMQQGVKAEAVYTDIDPDYVLDNPASYYIIDMDDNGTDDFFFYNTDFTYYKYPYGTERFQRLWVGRMNHTNRIAGSVNERLYSTYYYPFALNAGDVIGPDLSFQPGLYQALVLRTYDYLFPSLGTGFFTAGNWHPDIADHYIGVKFIDTLNHYHYGWIRCTVQDDGHTVVIKDYAYEQKPGIGIYAGDTIGDSLTHKDVVIDIDTTHIINSLPLQAMQGVSVYAFNKSIYIHLPQLPQPNTEVIVYDMLGREIYRQGIETTSIQIHLNTAAGIYLVTIQDKEGRYSKKVLVE